MLRPSRSQVLAVASRIACALVPLVILVAPASCRGAPFREVVLFVVLDMVRSEQASICGYARPTTPTLAALSQRGWTVSCNMRAPSSWTIPTHASFFTGLSLPEHGVHFSPYGTDVHAGTVTLTVTPLADEVQTLAEHFRSRDFLTVGVSGNPVVSDAAGLAQGFTHFSVADEFGQLYGDTLVDKVRQLFESEVSEAAAEKLFLFVNIADAHHPWLAIPEHHPFLPTRQGWPGYFHPGYVERYESLVAGHMDALQAQRLSGQLIDLYDFGVWRADATLRQLLNLLDARGLFEGHVRVVVTSDHGEAIGEHGYYDHRQFVWEPLVRVPFVAWDSNSAVEVPDGPFSGRHVFELLLNSTAIPADMPIAAALPGGPMPHAEGFAPHVAYWDGQHKGLYFDESWSVVDLGNDPEEEHLQPLADPSPVAVEYVQELQRSWAQTPPRDETELLERLRAIGYLR